MKGDLGRNREPLSIPLRGVDFDLLGCPFVPSLSNSFCMGGLAENGDLELERKSLGDARLEVVGSGREVCRFFSGCGVHR